MASKKIRLLVTGSLEEQGLNAALGRRFPNASFLKPIKLEAFTSAKLEAAFLTTKERQERWDEKQRSLGKKPQILPPSSAVKLAALKILRWETVLIPPSHLTYLRSLLTDIAVFLDDEFPQGETAPLTDPSRLWKEKTKLLRNLPKNP